jgi:hypothetical protein
MFLLWNEIKTKAIVFINDWKDTALYTGEEDETPGFENAFFNILDIDQKNGAVFEKNLESKEDGHNSQAGLFRNVSKGNNTSGPSCCIDPFWRGHILIERESLAGRKSNGIYEQGRYRNRLYFSKWYLSGQGRKTHDGK